MPPNPRVVKAFRAMREIGIPEEKTKPVLKNLLKLYDKNWELIEVENYRALADAILDAEESEAVGQKKPPDNAQAEAAEQKKKLEQAELMKALEEETQIPEEPERPLKRLRLRHQDGTPYSNGTPLKKPKLEEIEALPYAIPKSRSRALAGGSASSQQQSKDKGKQPVADADVTNESGSDTGLRPRHLRDKGKKPISPQTSPCKTRPASDRPSHGVRFKEPKPKKTALPLVKPKDEPVTDDTTQTEVPLAEVPLSVTGTESLTNGDASMETDLLNEHDRPLLALSNETSGHELATIPDESTVKLDIASSSSGEIKILLSCNSTGNPNLSAANVDTLLKIMEDKCLKSYRVLDSNFSVKKLMEDMCDSLMDIETGPTSPAHSLETCPANASDGLVGNEGDCEKDKVFERNGCQDTDSQSLVGVSNYQLTADNTSSLLDINDVAKGQESVIISLVNEVNTECPPAFHYIPKNAVFQNAYVNYSLARIGDDNSCSTCFGNCLTATTACACALQSGGEFAYTIDGLVKEELLDECIKMNRDPQKHCLFYCKECPLERSKNEEIVESCKGHSVRSFIKECWLKCGCNKQCGNRVVQRGIQRKLQVFMTPGGKGWGLRTLEDLPKGAFVCEYVGEVLTNAELYERVSRSANKDEHAYPVLLDADWAAESELKDEEALCLDATYYGNVARFINHRCFDSTLVEIPVEVENPDHHYYHLAFFTTRKVKALEELTWDYGIDFDDSEHPVKAFKCRCGSRYCRNIKRPNRTRKRRYN
nr:probable inactive histone-lysine N-methyltransferase SUVR2 [Tanacetum cinerariifolium]